MQPWVRKVTVNAGLHTFSNSGQSRYCAFFFFPPQIDRIDQLFAVGGLRHLIFYYQDVEVAETGIHLWCDTPRNVLLDLFEDDGKREVTVRTHRASPTVCHLRMGDRWAPVRCAGWGPGSVFHLKEKGQVFSLVVLILFGIFCFPFQAVPLVKE